MSKIPDLTDPRYLDEVGWFLYHEKYERDKFGGSYDNERLAYSRLLLEEVLKYMGRDERWLKGKTVVSIGCGCTGDLASFPAALKIAIDPLLNVYQKLGMLLIDVEGTSQTVYLSMDSEDLPLVDNYADLVLCRNALDHMPDPGKALREFQRILKNDGSLFVSVDIGGAPTPDEPTVFSIESLSALIEDQFKMLLLEKNQPPHSVGRDSSVRLLAKKKKPRISPAFDKEKILKAYESRIS